MPCSEEIEERIDAVVHRWKDLEKKNMFGGICYLLRGNMCFGIYRDFLIVRLGVEAAGERMGEEGVRPFDITGRPMKGWVMVGREGWKGGNEMKEWLASGRSFARSLPPK